MPSTVIVNNIRLPFSVKEDEAVQIAIKKLGPLARYIQSTHIAKKSLDARHKNEIAFVYSVGVELAEDLPESALKELPAGVTAKKAAVFSVEPGDKPLQTRPLVVGFGPAGMFAALTLSRFGYRPLIFERGPRLDIRAGAVEAFWNGGPFDKNANVQFGEGGAGAFSDGKLTTRINDPYCSVVLQDFIRFGAPEEIAVLAKPHIGTDRLRRVVQSIRREIIKNGGEFYFNRELTDIRTLSGKIVGAAFDGGEIPCEALVAALGHSARETFQMFAARGASFESKPFSVGVRIEHLQAEIDKALYGRFAGHPALPKGEYQLSLRQGDRAVYTFCMCPGGQVVAAASDDGETVTNGMSFYKRDGLNANAALVVSVDGRDFGEHVFDGFAFQHSLEQAAFLAGGGDYKAPFQTASAFLSGKRSFSTGKVRPTYRPGVEPYELEKLFPSPVTAMLRTGLLAFDRKLRGFAQGDSLLTGVESRTSSPVRMLRDANGESKGIGGVYPAGEGAGYAGGIMSAAVDGIRAAEAVIRRFAAPK